MSNSMLSVDGITKRFGGLVALNSLSFSVEHGAIHALIGPNGSGKTTFFNVVTGVLPCDGGRCAIGGVEVTNRACHEIARLGVSRTFQAPALFRTMSVLDNVVVGSQCSGAYSVVDAMLGRDNTGSLRDEALKAIDFVGLHANLREPAVSLPYGAQRLLEIARALATKPKLLLLDEPAAGMNPEETKLLAALIRRIRDELGITVLLIEHNMNMVMKLAEVITCIDHGHKIMDGPPSDVARNPEVIKAYLGENRPRRRRALQTDAARGGPSDA